MHRNKAYLVLDLLLVAVLVVGFFAVAFWDRYPVQPPPAQVSAPEPRQAEPPQDRPAPRECDTARGITTDCSY